LAYFIFINYLNIRTLISKKTENKLLRFIQALAAEAANAMRRRKII